MKNHTFIKTLALIPFLATAPMATAQHVGGCDGPAASAAYIYEPFSQTIQEFAGRTIRLTALDEGPDERGSGMMAQGSYHLMVTLRREDGAVTSCALVSSYETDGFFGLELGRINSMGMPGIMTTISLPVERVIGGDAIDRRTLTLTVDAEQGTIAASY